MTFLAILTAVGAALNIALAVLTICCLRDNGRRMNAWQSQEESWRRMALGRIERLERRIGCAPGGQARPAPGKTPEGRSRNG